MKNKYLLFLVVLFMSIGLYAQNTKEQKNVDKNPIAQEFIKELKQKTSDIKTIFCKFSQTQSLSILSKKVVKEGQFFYERPDDIFLDFYDGDYIHMTSNDFSMKNGDNVTKMKIEKNPMLRELKRMLSSCMTGEILTVSKDFQSTLTKDEERYKILMTPKKKRLASRFKNMVLVFNRKDMCLTQMQMTQPNGDYTLYDFFGKKLNLQSKPAIKRN